MNVTVYGPLRGSTGEKHVEVAFDGGTVHEAIDAFVETYPRAATHLYDGGELRPSVRTTVDDEPAGLDDACPADATLTLHPAIRGG